MEARGLKEFTKDGVKIECKGGKKATTRTTTKEILNEDKFKKENEEAYNIYRKYVTVETKTSPVSATPNKITVTILEE